MTYYSLVRDMTKFNYRFWVVKKALEVGISKAAREFKTTRKTVRKWRDRYEKKNLQGLKDQSRRPKSVPNQMAQEDEEKVVNLRESHKKWGARRLKERYRLKGSERAIHRVIAQRCELNKGRKRAKKRRNLSEMKKQLKFFEKSQVDTKDLSDILNYWPAMKFLNLSRYEYALRELSTGASFFAYADENNSTYAGLFAEYVLEHLKSYGIDTARIAWQTDNGSEYIGSVNKKSNSLSAFEEALARFKVGHNRIPPRCSWMQGDVETFNRIVEDEFFDVESFKNNTQFLGKTYAYQLYFNYIRTNRYRDNKSPVMILKKRFPNVDPNVLNLPPIRLESLLNNPAKSGYHVPAPAQREHELT
ncbi:MAG: transposase [Chlamydiae bacterium]|nr:transposase [Chlamydiota bacterium]